MVNQIAYKIMNNEYVSGFWDGSKEILELGYGTGDDTAELLQIFGPWKFVCFDTSYVNDKHTGMPAQRIVKYLMKDFYTLFDTTLKNTTFALIRDDGSLDPANREVRFQYLQKFLIVGGLYIVEGIKDLAKACEFINMPGFVTMFKSNGYCVVLCKKA